jgi:hypothetical protein
MKTGPDIVTDGLVFGYDTGYGVADNVISTRFYKGKPTANTWNKNTHSYTSGDITATRNATPPVPPPIEVQGFEVYKLQSNDGALNQGIMGTSQVVNGVGGDYVHSVYCYLESGSTVTVGQHWHPWAYGSSQTPPIGEWVRLSQTVTNAVTNYGNIANAYRTNGIAYFTAPQYELGSDVSPHVDGTRSSTTSLIDLKKTTDIDVSNVSFDSTGQPEFDGTDDSLTIPGSTDITSDAKTIEIAFKMNGSYSNFSPLAVYANGSSATNRIWLGLQNNKFQMHGWGTDDPTGTTTISADEWYICTFSYNKSTQAMKIYTNGVLESSTTNSQGGVTAASNMNWYIGTVPGGWQSVTYSNVDVPIFKVYNRILSDSEVKQNFNAYRKRFGI